MHLETGNIQRFLQKAYTDEKLAALTAHTEDGKVAYGSCCCLIGIPGADHALLEAGGYCAGIVPHVDVARRQLPYAFAAEIEFFALGKSERPGWPPTDELRRERLLPLLYAERDRRAQSTTAILDETPETVLASR
jgi:hypothetical protein